MRRVEYPHWVCEWNKPKDAPGPCRWRLVDYGRQDVMFDGHVILISGECRTYKEARGLLSRIERAMWKAYRAGFRAARKGSER